MKGFTAGDRVLHAQYGTGTLTNVNEFHTVIDFDEHGVRKFVTNLVALERSQVAAPERPAAKTGRKRAAARSRA